MKLISWNVNGIRAVQKKGFIEWVNASNADIISVQETKAHQEQCDEALIHIKGYESHWFSAEKKGYSSVATYSKLKPLKVIKGFNKYEYDSEGRVLQIDYEAFTLFNIYFPNGERSEERLIYKLNFYEDILEHFEKCRKEGKKLIICGDVNTAHKEIDLARPKENENTSGFLPIERAWIDKLMANDFVDTFRYFYPEVTKQYTWWSMRTAARERNIGWRIDYFFISKELVPYLKSAFILDKVMGSDHCPVGIEIEI